MKIQQDKRQENEFMYETQMDKDGKWRMQKPNVKESLLIYFD